ncbi:MAG: diguanylate cyclase [Sulfurimonas sp.]|nr:diguanylate cyclase [Sulfurimonas sp.]MDQ7061520.1 diguanylate cyclase [Sulfurimonas sp.]
MQRILIVEDNKTLAKLIAKKIQETLKFEVDVAYTLHEAKLFLRINTYFVTLLDLNLPDAPNGEVVDYVLAHDNKAIVLSGNIDKEFRTKMLQKNIIDYVNKGGVGDINYIIYTIQRLQKNQNHKILVVDDSMIFRKQMKNMLDILFYNVITVAHGEEALAMLQTHSDISLVITDYNMPVMDGLELTREIRKTHSKDALSIIALSSNNDSEINAMFLKNGANDYITKPFSKEEFSCRINNTIESLENLNIVMNHANRDFLTGLYNRRYFFKSMQEYIENIADTPEKYALAMIDIDHFKKVNDTYGHDTGDKVITHLSEILTSTTNYRDMVARFGGEEFCVILKNVNRYSARDILDRLRQEVENTVVYSIDKQAIKFTVSIGLVMSSEDALEDIIDQADMALYKAKQDGRNMVVLD